MRSAVRTIGLLLALLMLVTTAGCTWLPGKTEPQAPEPTPEPPPPPPPVTAVQLFPSQDQHMRFLVTDRDKEPVSISEEWIHESDRLMVTYGGVPYLTWVINDEGVWRQDPKGGGALLRYLPRELQDGETWKQASGNGEVWFHLARAQGQCRLPGGAAPDQCWALRVLNRGELTQFLLATGAGPVRAEADNWAHPADSFLKELTAVGPAVILGDDRTKLIEQFKPPTATPAPITQTTAAEFQAAVTATQPKPE